MLVKTFEFYNLKYFYSYITVFNAFYIFNNHFMSISLLRMFGCEFRRPWMWSYCFALLTSPLFSNYSLWRWFLVIVIVILYVAQGCPHFLVFTSHWEKPGKKKSENLTEPKIEPVRSTNVTPLPQRCLFIRILTLIVPNAKSVSPLKIAIANRLKQAIHKNCVVYLFL